MIGVTVLQSSPPSSIASGPPGAAGADFPSEPAAAEAGADFASADAVLSSVFAAVSAGLSATNQSVHKPGDVREV